MWWTMLPTGSFSNQNTLGMKWSHIFYVDSSECPSVHTKFSWFERNLVWGGGRWAIPNDVPCDPIQRHCHGHGGPKCVKITDFKGYLLRQHACCQKTDGESWHSKTISEFLIFILIRHHMTFKLMVFYLWQTNFASHEELSQPPYGAYLFASY